MWILCIVKDGLYPGLAGRRPLAVLAGPLLPGSEHINLANLSKFRWVIKKLPQDWRFRWSGVCLCLLTPISFNTDFRSIFLQHTQLGALYVCVPAVPQILFFLVSYVAPMLGLSTIYCHLGTVLWTRANHRDKSAKAAEKRKVRIFRTLSLVPIIA